MNAKDQPSEEDLRLLKEMGMTEVEPSRWSSGWQGSDPGAQDWLDELGSEGEEQLDLCMHASPVENEFYLERTGSAPSAGWQRITGGSLADAPPVEEPRRVSLAVFVGMKVSSGEDLDALDAETIESALDDVLEKYETSTPRMQ